MLMQAHIFLEQVCKGVFPYQYIASLLLGDPDENVYIVQSGRLNVFITGNEGINTLKIVKPGESVTSLLSFTDVLTVSYLAYIF